MTPTIHAAMRNRHSDQPTRKQRKRFTLISTLSVAASLLMSTLFTGAPAVASSVVTVTTQCDRNITVVANVGDMIRFQLPFDCAIDSAVFDSDGAAVDAGPLNNPTSGINFSVVDTFPTPAWQASSADAASSFVVVSQLTGSFRASRRALQTGATIGNFYGGDLNIYRIIYGGAPTPAPSRFTLNFDANGGTCTRESSGLVNEGTWITVPTAEECSRPGYELVGFNVSKDGSSPVGFDPGGFTVMTSDNTVYAIWRSLEPERTEQVLPEPTYPTITITARRDRNLVVLRGNSTVAKSAEATILCWARAKDKPEPCGSASVLSDGSFVWAAREPRRGWVMAVVESTMSNTVRLPRQTPR